MASLTLRRFLRQRILSAILQPTCSFNAPLQCQREFFICVDSIPSKSFGQPYQRASRSFCTPPAMSQVPQSVDFRSALQEDEFHELADSTIHGLLEKLEEYGDSVEIDGFDIDYGNEVLTLKLGSLGTYVINKQTPNRQIWLSSPVSGPSRYDWDPSSQAWVYRRTKASLLCILESELEKLCNEPITLSLS